MEDLPSELRTPPVPLTALVGCSDLHTVITTHLLGEQPPINALALPDFSKISLFARNPKDSLGTVQQQPVGGILKREWLSKHRTRIPSVVAALFSSDHVSGDPAQWLQVCTDLENLKGVTKARNIRLVVVVVVVTQTSSKDEISEERMVALRKRAEVDSKSVLVFIPDDPVDLKQSLNRLRNTLAELANIYYKDEGRRIKGRLEKKNSSSVELQIRYNFKVAAFAEFRRDWHEALRLYQDAYHALREMVGTSTRLPPIQRLVEIKTVAEQIHFKIATLLLHGGKIADAIIWFRQHIDNYKKLTGEPNVFFLHCDWLSRQYLVFAELLETSSASIQNLSSAASGNADKLTEWEFSSAYYYQSSAQHLKEKSSFLEVALSVSEPETTKSVDEGDDSVVHSIYLGQFARVVELGDILTMQPLKDEEFMLYALSVSKKSRDSSDIVELFRKSFEVYNKYKASRMASYCGFQIGKAYFTVNDFNNAKPAFENVASLYRQEGWVNLLWEVLGYLRESSRRIGSVKDFIEHSLEMAAMPVSDYDSSRKMIHKEVLGVVKGEAVIEENNALKVTDENPLYLEIDVLSPLRVVLLASVAFHEQLVKPGVATKITLSLLTQLPLDTEIDQLEIQFNQSECNFIVVNGQRPEVGSISRVQPGHRMETAPTLELETNKWLRLTYDIISKQSGKLECIYVIARIGQHFSICCRAESPASMNDLPLWKFENRVETIPTKDPSLTFSGQKAIQIEEPDPQVDLNLASLGPALVGENFIVPVTITSKGHSVHSGELKINLVDTRGGGLLSPREVEPFSADNLHVELVSVSGHERQDNDDETGSDSIQKIQPSFGLISVPVLEEGKSWSCKLIIKWNRAKPIMLYVSLGYIYIPTSQKLHVHKSLQIEGKNAITIKHSYMLPYRSDPLLPSIFKSIKDPDELTLLPLQETSILVITAKNCTELPLRLLSISINSETDDSCTVKQKDVKESAVIVQGEEYKKLFAVMPERNLPKLEMGTVCLKWRRHFNEHDEVLTKVRLPDVNVELPPLIIKLDCPPHAVLGVPFTYSIRISNRTCLLQEINYSVADCQSFMLAGPHKDTVLVLPKSEHILSFKLVPLVSGSQSLPRASITSVRYSAGFLHSNSASTIFVFPSKQQFDPTGNNLTTKFESVASQ